jgi:hypothetical protein
MFERAVREKSRWSTPRGLATVEDLWDLPLTSLNQIAKDLNKKVKEIGEEDFLADNKVEDDKLKNEFDIVIYILNTKKKEKEDRENLVARKAEKAKLLEILNRKQEDSLQSLSEEELRKRIESL